MLSIASNELRHLKVAVLLFALLVFQQEAEGCDQTFYLNSSSFDFKSPGYPSSYPPKSSCRYKFVAPFDYQILVDCKINLGQTCGSEYFYIDRDGDKSLAEAEQFCGCGRFKRKSLFRSVVLAYISKGSRGIFRCQMRVVPQPCMCGWSMGTKISQGQETSMNEFPSMVALKYRTNTLEGLRAYPYCSAAIISHKYLLSAAHCIEHQNNPALVEAWVGRHNIISLKDTKYAAVYYIRKMIPHPEYNSITLKNDIGILETINGIEYSRGVGPICLPYANINFLYVDVKLAGWGSTKFGGGNSPTLQKVTLKTTDNKACARIYTNMSTIYKTQICTFDPTGSGKDSCQLDSGGPVIFLNYTRQVLVGIISYGKECGYSVAGVNTRVTSYLPWIYGTVPKLNSNCR